MKAKSGMYRETLEMEVEIDFQEPTPACEAEPAGDGGVFDGTIEILGKSFDIDEFPDKFRIFLWERCREMVD